MYLLEHDKKREKRIKSAKKYKIHYEIKKEKVKGTPENGSRIFIRIPIKALSGNTAKITKNFQPFILDPLSTNPHCATNELFKTNISKVTKKYIDFSIKSFNDEVD